MPDPDLTADERAFLSLLQDCRDCHANPDVARRESEQSRNIEGLLIIHSWFIDIVPKLPTPVLDWLVTC